MEIKIKHEEIVAIAEKQLPALLQDTFSSSYNNPLKKVLEEILKSDELKNQLEKIVFEVYKEVAEEVDFKAFVKEAIVHSVIREMQKLK